MENFHPCAVTVAVMSCKVVRAVIWEFMGGNL